MHIFFEKKWPVKSKKTSEIVKNCLFSSFQHLIDLKLLLDSEYPIKSSPLLHKIRRKTRRSHLNSIPPRMLELFFDVKLNFKGFSHALENLDEFSHVWILFVFHANSDTKAAFTKTKVAPPRQNGKKVGLFSTRSPHRPNPIGKNYTWIALFQMV